MTPHGKLIFMNKQLFAKGMLIATVILMDILVGMEFDLFVPSFPELQSQFGLTPAWVEASLSVNFIGYCLSLFIVGNMADRYGRKPVIIGGLITFVMATLLCLWAPSYTYLLIGRFFQGAGIAAPAILSFLLIADSFALKKQQFYMAMLNGIMNVSIACAPVLGSYITLYFHWQGNFIALLLLGIIALIMSLLCVPKHTAEEKKPTVSYLALAQSKPLMLLVVNITFMFVPWWIFVGISPLLYMEDLGVSLSHFGYYQGGLALVFAIGSILYGLTMHKFDQEKMLKLSNKLFIFSLAALAVISLINCTNPLIITLTFLLFIIGQIVPTIIIFPLCLNYVPEAKGRVGAIIQIGRLILSSFGLQVAGFYYTGSFQNVGIILACFILLTIFTSYSVMRDATLMRFCKP